MIILKNWGTYDFFFLGWLGVVPFLISLSPFTSSPHNFLVFEELFPGKISIIHFLFLLLLLLIGPPEPFSLPPIPDLIFLLLPPNLIHSLFLHPPLLDNFSLPLILLILPLHLLSFLLLIDLSFSFLLLSTLELFPFLLLSTLLFSPLLLLSTGFHFGLDSQLLFFQSLSLNL